MDTIMLLGLLAGTLTTVSFLPQLVKAWCSRSTRDISLAMYAIISSGVLLWLIYGVMISSLPVILANAASLLIVLLILALKIRYR
jgi:MtN3 and saliva related transmembrane protein